MYEGNELITVLMTTYNREMYVRESIRSVLDQTYTNIQFIIINDGSTDSTAEILDNINDNRVQVIHLPENRHISYATNAGYDHIRGDYVAVMDSDDIWKADKLEKQLEYMKAHPEHEACFTWGDIIDENGADQNAKYWDYKCLFSATTGTREEWLRFFFYKGNRLINPSSLVKTKALKKIGKHNPFYIQAQDMEWWVRFTKEFSFGVIQEPLMCIRVLGNNTTSYENENDSRRTRFYNEMMQIRYHFFDDIDRELFINAFKQDFVCEDSSTDEELKCEQAFLMMKPFENCKSSAAVALIKFDELMNDPATADVLWKKFGFGTRQIGVFTEQNLYFDSYAEQLDNENARLRKQHKKDIEKIYSSTVVSNIVRSNNKLLEDYSDHLNKELKEIKNENTGHKQHIAELEAELRRVSNSLNTVVNSSSWKLTAPLRKIKDRKNK